MKKLKLAKAVALNILAIFGLLFFLMGGVLFLANEFATFATFRKDYPGTTLLILFTLSAATVIWLGESYCVDHCGEKGGKGTKEKYHPPMY